jgi:putative heme-binding domain-containing protein
MRRFSNDLRAGTGSPAAGRALFKKHCGNCHVLFGEGTAVGPDLTQANRGDAAALLAQLVDPSAVVRKEYASFVAATTDGRVVTGLLVERDPAGITLLDSKNERHRIGLSQLESLEESAVSQMPERLLDGLSPQELRDLFAWLQGDGP